MTTSILHMIHHHRRQRLQTVVSKLGSCNDRELLKRFARQKDEPAFEELVHRYGSLVLSVAKRIVGEHQEAEDVLQATFFVLARKAGAIPWKATIAPWLYATAYRLACNARKRQRRPLTPLKNEPSHLPHQTLGWNETCQMLDEELMKLSEPTRAALILCYLEGKTRDEAAQHLGLSLATVKRRLEQGRHLLRDRLTRRGLAFSAAGWCMMLSKSELDAATIRSVKEAALATNLPASTALLVKAGTTWTLASFLVVMISIGAAGSWWCLTQPVHTEAHGAIASIVQQKINEDTPKVDTYGDPLPEGALGRLGTIRFRPGQMLHDIAFSPDRRYLAGWLHGYLISQGKSRLVYWDAITGQEVRSLDLPKNHLLTLRWLSDGRLLALTRFAHGHYHLCEFAPGKETTFPEADSNSLNSSTRGDIRSAAISPDGQWVATGRRSAEGEYQPIELWEAKPNTTLDDQRPIQIGTYPGHGLYLQFSNDGKQLIALCRSQGAMIHVPSEKRVIGQPVGSLIDGAWEEKATVIIFDVATRKQLRSFKIAPPPGYSELFPPPSRMALTKDGGTLYVGDETGKVHGYDCLTGEETIAMQIYEKDAKANNFERPMVASLAVTDDHRTLYASTMHSRMQEWDISKKQKRRTMTDLDWVDHIALSSDGQKVVAVNPSITTQLAIYDTVTGHRQGGSPGHQFYVNSLTLLTNDQLMTTATDRQVIWWDLKTNKEVKRQTCPLLPGYQGMLSYSEEAKGQFGFLPDHRNLAFCDLDGQTTTCTCITGDNDFIRSFSLAGSGIFYSNKTGLLHYWDAKTKALKKTYPHALDDIANSLSIVSVILSPDQSTVIAFSNGQLNGDGKFSYRCNFMEVFDAATGKQKAFWHIPANARCNGHFSPDGKRLLVTCQYLGNDSAPKTPVATTLQIPEKTMAALFDLPSGKLLGSYKNPNEQSWMPSTALFTHDGQHVVIAWNDASIGFYETATGKLLRTYTGHRGEISAMRFLDGEKRLATASDDGTCLIWDVSLKALSEGKKTGKD
ncbi:MAG TPA: sigma-70 family RNA polymerase sigma factor [Gemmatales bacterium]|nr:sigma-70 family RNA polymerase sigma factor [Gemmatales bacterium]